MYTLNKTFYCKLVRVWYFAFVNLRFSYECGAQCMAVVNRLWFVASHNRNSVVHGSDGEWWTAYVQWSSVVPHSMNAFALECVSLLVERRERTKMNEEIFFYFFWIHRWRRWWTHLSDRRLCFERICIFKSSVIGMKNEDEMSNRNVAMVSFDDENKFRTLRHS